MAKTKMTKEALSQVQSLYARGFVSAEGFAWAQEAAKRVAEEEEQENLRERIIRWEEERARLTAARADKAELEMAILRGDAAGPAKTEPGLEEFLGLCAKHAFVAFEGLASGGSIDEIHNGARNLRGTIETLNEVADVFGCKLAVRHGCEGSHA